MPSLHSARIWLDFGIKEDNTADLAEEHDAPPKHLLAGEHPHVAAHDDGSAFQPVAHAAPRRPAHQHRPADHRRGQVAPGVVVNDQFSAEHVVGGIPAHVAGDSNSWAVHEATAVKSGAAVDFNLQRAADVDGDIVAGVGVAEDDLRTGVHLCLRHRRRQLNAPTTCCLNFSRRV